MSNAILVATTAAPVTAPALPSRRRLLAGSGLAAGLAALALPAAAAVALAPADPVVALYAEWRANQAAGDAAEQRHTELWALMVARYGESRGHKPAAELWGADPLYGEMDDARQRSDDAQTANCDVLDAIEATPATSLEGIQCKLLVALDVWRFIERPNAEPEYHETATVALLRDAARFIGAGAGA